jgi:hypothetical protein
MMVKQLLSAAAIALTFAIFVPYIVSVRRGQTKPHVFSWVIWALAMFVVAPAQRAGDGGVGAWSVGVSGLITAYIAVDLAGFGPTFRSAYAHPHGERMGFYAFAAVRNLLAILALEHYSMTTVLFPAAVGLGCIALVAMVAYRCKQLAHV